MAGHPGQAEYWNPGTWQLHLGKCLPSHKFKWHSSDKWQLQQVIIMWQAKYAEIGHERFDRKKVAPSQVGLGPGLTGLKIQMITSEMSRLCTVNPSKYKQVICSIPSSYMHSMQSAQARASMKIVCVINSHAYDLSCKYMDIVNTYTFTYSNYISLYGLGNCIHSFHLIALCLHLQSLTSKDMVATCNHCTSNLHVSSHQVASETLIVNNFHKIKNKISCPAGSPELRMLHASCNGHTWQHQQWHQTLLNANGPSQIRYERPVQFV